MAAKHLIHILTSQLICFNAHCTEDLEQLQHKLLYSRTELANNYKCQEGDVVILNSLCLSITDIQVPKVYCSFWSWFLRKYCDLKRQGEVVLCVFKTHAFGKIPISSFNSNITLLGVERGGRKQTRASVSSVQSQILFLTFTSARCHRNYSLSPPRPAPSSCAPSGHQVPDGAVQGAAGGAAGAAAQAGLRGRQDGQIGGQEGSQLQGQGRGGGQAAPRPADGLGGAPGAPGAAGRRQTASQQSTKTGRRTSKKSSAPRWFCLPGTGWSAGGWSLGALQAGGGELELLSCHCLSQLWCWCGSRWRILLEQDELTTSLQSIPFLFCCP